MVQLLWVSRLLVVGGPKLSELYLREVVQR